MAGQYDDDDDYSAVFGGGQRNAVAAVGADPQKAADALKLSGASGIPAEQIQADVPAYKAHVQQQAAAGIVAGNPTLAGFVANPIHAQVSNDDLATLDQISGHVKTATAPSIWQQAKDFLFKPDNFDKDAWEGVKEGFDVQGQRDEYERLYNYIDSPAWRGFMRGGGGVAAVGLGAALHLPGAVLGGVSGGVAGIYKDAGGSALEAERLRRDVNVLGQVALPELVPEAGMAHAQAVAAPWLREGKVPPRGVSPAIDEIHAAQNAKDLEALNSALEKTQDSLTRDRSPEAFKTFIQQHTGESVGISHDAVNALYGGKHPEPGEGPLGFVSDLPSQLLRSAVTGQDIRVPMSDWLTHVGPEDAKALEPYVRTRPEGVTADEAAKSTPTQAEPVVRPAEDSFAGKTAAAEWDGIDRDEEGNPIAPKPGAPIVVPPREGSVELAPASKEVPQAGGQFAGLTAQAVWDGVDRDIVPRTLAQQPSKLIKAENTAVRGYTGALFRSINTYLREGPEAMDAAFSSSADRMIYQTKKVPAHIAALDKVMNRSSLDQDTTLYRAATLPDDVKPGDLVEDRGFMSTGSSSGNSRAIADDNNSHFITIEAPAGTRAHLPGANAMERSEIIVDRGTHLRILSVDGKEVRARIERQNGSVDQAIQKQAGLSSPTADVGPQFEDGADEHIRAYPAASGVPEWTRQFPHGDETFIDRRNGVDRYASIGKPEPTIDALQGLRAIVGRDGLPPEELANSLLAEGIVKHVGADQVPSYYVAPENPSVHGAYGMYYPDSHIITMRNTGDARSMLQTQSHEAIHAALFHAIDHVPGVAEAFDHLLTEARAAEGDVKFSEAPHSYMDGGDEVATQHYGLTNRQEFAAEVATNPKFQRYLSGIEASPRLRDFATRLFGEEVGGRIKNLFDMVLQVARKAFGLEGTTGNMSLLEAAFKTMAGTVEEARTYGSDPRSSSVGPARQALAQPLDSIAERARSIGMNRDQLARYRELIAKQREEASASRNAEILREERKRQTEEWKANAQAMRPQVAEDFRNRRDVIAEKRLREGDKIDVDSLGKEAQSTLGAYATRGGGTDAADLATSLGFDSVEQMGREVSALNAERGTQRHDVFSRRMVNDEIARRMEATHGKLDENVVSAAQDRVLNEAQMQVLQAEAEAAGNPFSKARLETNVREQVDGMKMEQAQAAASISAAGKAGRGIEDALLKNDGQEAFAQRMRQYNNLLAAKELAKVEKMRGQFDATMKRFSTREVAGASQEYVDQIHALMLRLGQGVKRSVQDIEASLSKSGYDNFGDFIDQKEGDFRDLFVPEWLRDPTFSTLVDQLTVAQFKELHNAIKALTFNARDELKITKAGEKADFVETRDEMLEKLQSLGPAKQYAATETKRSLGALVQHYWWSSINMEKMLNRVDRGDRQGVFFQSLTRMYTEAVNGKERMTKEFQERINEFGRIEGYERPIEQTTFIDPTTRQAVPMQKKHVLGVLQNAGNESNMRKLAAGWKTTPEAVMDFLAQHTTKEDWDRAQSIGDMFDDLHERADNMSRAVSGVGVDKLPITPVTGPFGEYRGWYNPIKYDELRYGKSKTMLSTSLEQEGYYRANTPQGYTKQRTAYVAPLELSLDVVPTRMHQMIHDINMRPAVIQLNKFFTDPQFRQAMVTYYGKAQETQLVPFLRDLANSPNYQSASASVGASFLRELSSNMTSTLVGFNPGTMAKHSSTAAIKSLLEGRLGFAKEMATMFSRDDLGQSQWSMAMEKSDELSRRAQTYEELINNSGQTLGLHTSRVGSRYKDVKAWLQHVSTKPIAVTGMMSSVPLWLSEYKRMIAEGHDEGAAIAEADAALRDTHGSSALSNKPQISRNVGPVAQTFASLYNVFSENLQKQYELAWRAKDSFRDAQGGDWSTFQRNIPKMASIAFTSILVPALIEEAVTGEGDPKEGWGHKAGRVMFNGLTSSVIGIRDMARSLSSGYDSSGMVGTMEKAAIDPARDLNRMGKDLVAGHRINPDRSARLIKHGLTLTGLLTGLTNAQEGRSLEYAYRYFHGLERPRDPWQAAVGLRYGETRRR